MGRGCTRMSARINDGTGDASWSTATMKTDLLVHGR